MNIEKTISEHAVSDILTPMLESQDRIVTEDVAPLFDQATGLDTPPASGTVTTTIEESRSVITAIIRKAWTATLTMLGGASVISYIAAAYTYLRNRLQGNETYGIPDRRSEISASSPLAANLALLNDRKIGGVPEAADGMSMARILCDSAVAATITEITDDNTGWSLTRNISTIINNYFPSLAKIKLLCTKLTVNTLFDNVQTAELEVPELRSLNNESDNHNVVVLRNCANVEEFSAPIKVLGAGTAISNNAKLRVLRLPECDYIGGWSYDVPITNNPNLEEAYLNSYTPSTNAALANPIGNCQKLWKVVFGVVRSLTTWGGASSAFVSSDCTKVRHLEIGGATVSFSLANWTPDEDTIAHQDFLQNFRSYIALRLTDNGSGKTLTLSQAVFSAVIEGASPICDEIKGIIEDKGWKVQDTNNNIFPTT